MSTLETMVKIAVFASGRFQPPTIGHAKMINEIIDIARKVGGDAFVFVSSTAEKEADKNILTSSEKVKYLEMMFPKGVQFIDTSKCGKDNPCSGPPAARNWLVNRGYTEFHLVAGSDREALFTSDRLWPEVEKPMFHGLERQDADKNLKDLSPEKMSSSKARALAKADMKDAFITAIGLGPEVGLEIYKKTRAAASLRGGANEEGEDWTSFSADQGGRRRKTRRGRRRATKRINTITGRSRLR